MEKRYLLDTNICIAMFKGRADVSEKLIKYGFSRCAISELTIAELYYGAYKSNAPIKHIEEISKVKERFDVISISSSLETFGQLKAEMERSGNKIDDFDLLIGATAINHDLIMVTDNVKHLGKIPGVQVENWIERA